MLPVARMILFMFSRWCLVMICSSPNHLRAGIRIVPTMAKPENTAPATKYGGKIAVCQPGICEVAKSNDTTECTDSTSGVARPASSRYAFS